MVAILSLLAADQGLCGREREREESVVDGFYLKLKKARCLQLRDCVVSEWSAWSAPLAFGVVERSRHIIQEGQCCPDELLQQVNITSYLSEFFLCVLRAGGGGGE